MVSGYLCQGGRGCNHKCQGDEGPGVEIVDGTHFGIDLPQLIREIVRMDILGKFGHDACEDKYMSEYRVVRWHCLEGHSALLLL